MNGLDKIRKGFLQTALQKNDINEKYFAYNLLLY